MSLVFLYSKVRLHSGFIVRQLGASAAQLAYVLPPPPTIVGSFMNPLARLLGLGESLYSDPKKATKKVGPAGSKVMECALSATLSAAAGLDPVESDVGVIVYAEPSRIAAALYKTGKDYRDALKKPPYLAAGKLLPVQAVGAASAPGAVLALAWLLDRERLSDCLGATLGPGDLGRAAWSIYRVGSREGITSVINAGVFEGSKLEAVSEGDTFESIMYQSAECVRPLTTVSKVTLYDILYKERSYLAPGWGGGPSGLTPPSEPASFELRSGCEALRPSRFPELTLSYPVQLRR